MSEDSFASEQRWDQWCYQIDAIYWHCGNETCSGWYTDEAALVHDNIVAALGRCPSDEDLLMAGLRQIEEQVWAY